MCKKIPGSVYDNEVKQTLFKFKRSTKGMLLLNATAHQRSYSSQRFGYNHGIKKTPVFSKFKSPKEHHGVALRVFTSHLSISDSLFSLPPFLNPFPSEARGVADELFHGDSSTSWANHRTAVVRLPSRLSLEAVNS
ncbi:hypothetical protein AVEN_179796-1 [Araneus ventricosus]|uniref:Uncharacterized protein n=1 Tax=Araneus ventricosus TaxID=182803 RepID=A0A4Y2G142_ARAVE|nr:hypothetical protein AVEN_179796-1 [Araneus ventricosus]